MTYPRLLLALLFTILAARVAVADDGAIRTARHHFERGEKLYALARFGEALDAYQRAFDAEPLPGFLFNIGQCHRNLGDYDAAVFSFRKYLRLAPEAANRARVEQLIVDLEARRDRAEARRLGVVHTGAGEPAPRGERAIYRTWWFWTGVAVVTGAAGVAIHEVRRPAGPPTTSLGNLVFGR